MDDANHAGTSKSKDCTLILTEGDSAKALAMSGLGVVGRDFYGVFPLKGKLLNVREASHAQIMKNEEIQNLAKIMGLTFGKKYEDTKELRYGHLMIMTDQDHDGSHIKGLLINFLHHFWPSLLKMDGFLLQFITPIVKCSKGKKSHIFYTLPQYQDWRASLEERVLKSWNIKYYKGLGTSTAAEAKEYFSDLENSVIKFEWDGDGASNVIDMAFSKSRVQDRKDWLLAMEPGTFVDYSSGTMSYDNFVNKELILFSHADNERSIPHFMDGLKPSQRKILFSCFKRNLKQEIKVAQLAGYVSEHSAYHHGEMSLTTSIVGMAQNFVGSNNINLLSPCGQFGTRLMGGKDAASSRYIFTKLEPITRAIYHPDDDAVLTYLQDDGQSIEPEFYAPIIPMVLVNGCDGIGTGWSSSVPNYNPREIISMIRAKISGEAEAEAVAELQPWFRGFGGILRPKTGKDEGNYSVFGGAELVNDTTILINELPVRKWTSDYKHMLETMVIGSASAAEDKSTATIVKDFKENHTDTTVKFTITLPAEKLAEALAEKGGVYKKFKLEGSIATTNMNLFDSGGHIHKYDKVSEIMDAFYTVRVEYYGKRKAFLLKKLGEEYEKLDNKVRFIMAVIAGEVVVSNRKKTDLLQELRKQGFTPFTATGAAATAVAGAGAGDDREEGGVDSAGYDYLLSMKLWSLTLERVTALTAERDTKRALLEELTATSQEQLWLADLDGLETALDDFEHALAMEQDEEEALRVKRSKGGKAPKKAAVYDSEDDDNYAMEDDEDDEDFGAKKKPKKKAAAPKKSNAPAPVLTTPIELPDVKVVVVRAKKMTKAAAATDGSVQCTMDETPAAAATADADDDSDMTLMQRLMARAAIDPTASIAAAPKKRVVKKKPPAEDFVVDDSDADDDSAGDSDSDCSFDTPKPTTKAKIAPTAKAAPKAKAAPRPKPKKPIVIDSDSEVSDDECVAPVEVAVSVSRPGRARKTTNYAAMLADSDEDDEMSLASDDDAADDEDDMSDEDESDFE